ncbi:ABC transporter ATP-binding protein [Leucobacter sp. UT-8R-CII-1-4]|uniref:ABC transporter ATP-binding protein n=1 Tax=Leucobacter sp. UT-8R-CII-1-4 TaxID=3040075 RepID=UPI0024A9CDA9|nr:ABC transporter ATP-binding protein [Leucobacter sp. UT-8R-CII-1-4]MDI6023674.1 ABC transporter ATP-binding protein [Leucobacter sp. UT-8R-CII-1-4]
MNTLQSAVPIIDVQNLTVSLGSTAVDAPALVHELSLQVRPGECVGLVGESGSGKSLTGLTTMGLLPEGLHVRAGEVKFVGDDLTSLSNAELRKLRGAELSMIFQDPSAALNPTRTVKKQLVDVLRAHQSLSKKEAEERAVVALEDVGFPNPRERFNSFPFQLSGGLKQRVCIAMALACRPRFVVADEPTTNLDVSVQEGILNLIRARIESDGFGCLFVSHDLGVIGAVADRVMVMYAGQIVEAGPVESILNNPQHPYTRGLIDAAPTLHSTKDEPLRPYTAVRPKMSPTRPASEMVPVQGNPEHTVRVSLETRGDTND